MVMTRARNWRWEELEKDTIELSALAKHFELYNRTEGKSPKTIDWHNLALRQFHRFLIESEKATSLGELGEAEVREFILYLQERYKLQVNPFISNHRAGLAAISIQTYIRALRAFFNWLYKQGYTNENRLAKLKPPKAPTKVVEILTQEEMAKVLGSIDSNTSAGCRNSATRGLSPDCSSLRPTERSGR